MAVPHYVYLLLKMPGNTGVLSLCGDLLKSFECDKEAIDHAATIRVPSSAVKYLLLLRNSHSRSRCLPRSQANHWLNQLVIVGAYQRHQRWCPQTPIWGGSISWTMNKSASARNTAVAFYPGVYRGVIYISAGKAVSERIYRLVGELYLDWIFSSINRGKIITW